MEQVVDEQLIKLGLSENEAKVYLAVLSLGPSSAVAIARQGEVKRPTVYMALEHLIKKGLVSEVASAEEKIFKAEAPDRLSKLTKKMRRQVIEAELQLESMLPGLWAMQKKLVEAPRVTFYQGMAGIRNILEDVAGCREPWHYFGSSEEIMKSLKPEEFVALMREADQSREKAGRPEVCVITDEAVKQVKGFWHEDAKLRHIRIVPALSKARSGFFIYGNKLAIVSVNDVPFGAVIESGEAAELAKLMFRFIWGTLEDMKSS